MTRTIYTFGYANRLTFEVRPMLRNLDAVLIDVRLKPFARNQTWSRTALLNYFGMGWYKWVEQFGNVNYKGGPVKLLDPANGLVAVGSYLAHRNIALMCQEADYRLCHRRIVADLISEHYGYPVEHLLSEDLPDDYLDNSGAQLSLFD